jgi:transcriptional regulator with XRE-family HTH domain
VRYIQDNIRRTPTAFFEDFVRVHAILPLQFAYILKPLRDSVHLCFGIVNAMEDNSMIIGERLRVLREQKNFSQGDVENRTGLLRCYISRVEHGHTVPAVETLEKFARALEVPMYKLFYDGEEPPKLLNLLNRKSVHNILWGNSGKDARLLAKFCRLFSRMEESNLKLVLFTAQKMIRRKAD